MPDFRLWILDLDGTVYRGSEPCPGAQEAIRTHLARGGIVRYLTNNSAATPEGAAAKIAAMGVPARPEWVWGTGPGARRWCEERGIARAYVIGDPPLHETFAGLGSAPEEAEAVVCGKCRSFSFEMIDAALQVFLRGGRFIATNRDGTYPCEGGRLEPGAGTMAAALAAAAGREPDAVIGKPSPEPILQIMREAGAQPEETVMAGDRFETDIAAGRAAGVAAWMVLTGIASELPEGQPGSADLLGLL